MAESHTPADDVIYDLVSIKYHALKGGQLFGPLGSLLPRHRKTG